MPRLGLKALHHVLQGRPDHAGRKGAGHAVHIGHGQGVQVVYQAGELHHLVAQAPHHGGCGLAHAVFNGFDFTAQH